MDAITVLPPFLNKEEGGLCASLLQCIAGILLGSLVMCLTFLIIVAKMKLIIRKVL